MEQKQIYSSQKTRRQLDELRLSILANTHKNDTPRMLETLEFMKNANFTLEDVRGVAILLYEGLVVDGWLLNELSNNQPITSPQTIIDYFSQLTESTKH